MAYTVEGSEKPVKARPGLNLNLLNASQRACMTKFTREGVLDMTNKKPYRTKEQKRAARKDAFQTNGTFYSGAPRSYHRKAS